MSNTFFERKLFTIIVLLPICIHVSLILAERIFEKRFFRVVLNQQVFCCLRLTCTVSAYVCQLYY